MPPRRPEKWAGIRDTLEYGDACPQVPYNLERPSGISWFTPFWPAGQSEDCLRLNVWTPALDSGKRPVLVWFHGGGYSRGSGGSSAYDGINMASRGDVVSVTVNHRLNVFGYAGLGGVLGGDFERSHDRELFELDDPGLVERTRRIYGEDAEEVLDTYRSAYADLGASDLYFVLASDGTRFRSIHLAEAKIKRGGAPIYMYRFDWLTPAWEGRFRAAHAFEIPFVFGNAQLNDEITGGGGPDAVALAAKMRDAWIAFARTGDPSHSELPAWPAYDTKTRATMLFNDVCTVKNDPGGAERLLWERIQGRT